MWSVMIYYVDRDLFSCVLQIVFFQILLWKAIFVFISHDAYY